MSNKDKKKANHEAQTLLMRSIRRDMTEDEKIAIRAQIAELASKLVTVKRESSDKRHASQKNMSAYRMFKQRNAERIW